MCNKAGGNSHRFQADPWKWTRAVNHFKQAIPRDKCHGQDLAGEYSDKEIMEKFGYRGTSQWVRHLSRSSQLSSTNQTPPPNLLIGDSPSNCSFATQIVDGDIDHTWVEESNQLLRDDEQRLKGTKAGGRGKCKLTKTDVRTIIRPRLTAPIPNMGLDDDSISVDGGVDNDTVVDDPEPVRSDLDEAYLSERLFPSS